MKTEREIADGYWLASEDREGELTRYAVLDSEGDLAYWLPMAFKEMPTDDQLMAIAVLCEEAREAGFRSGTTYGEGVVRRQVQELLGVRELVQGIGAVADEITTLSNAVSNLK